MQTVSKHALDLIKSFESLRLKAYHGAADREGIYTIGYGHVITGYEQPDLFLVGQMMKDVSITQNRANDLLEEDVDKMTRGVVLRLGKDNKERMTEDQLGALVSLAFNIGLGNFSKSTICETIRNGGTIEEAAVFFKSWVRANGVVVNGLIRRRAAEKALFLGDLDSMDFFLSNYSSAVMTKARKYLGI